MLQNILCTIEKSLSYCTSHTEETMSKSKPKGKIVFDVSKLLLHGNVQF